MKTDHAEFYRDEQKKWRWRYVRKNSRVMADSGEGYTKFIDARKAFTHVTGKNPVFLIDGMIPNHDPKKDLLAVKTYD